MVAPTIPWGHLFRFSFIWLIWCFFLGFRNEIFQKSLKILEQLRNLFDANWQLGRIWWWFVSCFFFGKIFDLPKDGSRGAMTWKCVDYVYWCLFDLLGHSIQNRWAMSTPWPDAMFLLNWDGKRSCRKRKRSTKLSYKTESDVLASGMKCSTLKYGVLKETAKLIVFGIGIDPFGFSNFLVVPLYPSLENRSF